MPQRGGLVADHDSRSRRPVILCKSPRRVNLLGRDKEDVMSIAVGTVTINAAFLQEIKEDNHELAELLESAAQMFSLARVARTPARRFVDLLMRLRDRLASHFALEEAFGYFEDAIEVAPHLSHMADELRGEHSTLYIDLCDLVEEAERLLYHETTAGAAKKIAARFREFHCALQEHEHRENQLILDSLDCDLGVGD